MQISDHTVGKVRGLEIVLCKTYIGLGLGNPNLKHLNRFFAIKLP